MSKRNALGAFAIIACAIFMLACGESSGTASVVSGNTNTSSQSSDQHFKVGQQVKLDGYVVTVNSIKKSAGDEFTMPKSGHTFVVIDVSIKNNTGQAQTFSSLASFTLQDATGQKYDETILSSATSPDGTIPNGGLLRGQVVYEVPTSQHKLTFSFQPDITSTDMAIWDLSY